MKGGVMGKIITLAGSFLLVVTLVVGQADDLLPNFPKMSSEAYLFAMNAKRLKKLKMIAIPEQEADLEDLKSLFEKSGFRVGIIPEDLIGRTMETGMMDCSVSTSKEFVSELKDRFPKGVIISLFPKPTILNQ
jgi:hypothetical protein